MDFLLRKKRRLFEDFLKEAEAPLQEKFESKAREIYVAARALEYDEWIEYVNDMKG